MNKNLIIILIIICGKSIAQSGWNYLPNSPIANYRFDDIYFTTDSMGWAVNGDGRIYKTTDAGNSWTLQLDSSQYYFRSVEFLNDTLGLAGTLSGQAFKTTDGGTTWNHIDQNFPQPVPGVCGIGHSGDTIIMQGIWSQPAFILRSIDAGNTWTYTDMSSLASGLVDCWFKSPDTIFVSGIGTAANNNNGVILRSTDGGVSWAQVGLSSYSGSYCWKLQFTSASIGYCSLSENTGSQTHFLKTTDGGNTWSTLYLTNSNIDGEGIGFANDTLGWAGGWSNGIYQTTNGGLTWNFFNFGLNFNRFVFRNQNLGYAAGQKIYKFTGTTTSVNSSLNNHGETHQLEINPNPVSDKAEIKLTLSKKTKTVLAIYDEAGILVKQLGNGIFEKGVYNYSILTTPWRSGLYYVSLRSNEHPLTRVIDVEHK